MIIQKTSDRDKNVSDIFDQLEKQLSDSEEGLHKRLDEVKAMIQDQESKLFAKIESLLQANLSKNMDGHHHNPT